MSIVSFFMSFCNSISDGKFNLIESSDQILFICCRSEIFCILVIFWIIKCVDFESIFFAINLDITSSSKVFSIFNYVFLSIVL